MPMRRLNNAAHNAMNALAAITVTISICSNCCACVSITVANTAVTTAAEKNANNPIRQIPTGNAAARQLLEICSAGVVIKLSS